MTDRNSQQDPLPENIVNIQPSAVKKWIDDLPLGSTGESSKQLYDTLRKVNKQTNSLNQHIEFLEAIAPTLTLLYPRLSQFFSESALPHGIKTRNVIHVTTSLLNEVLHGYQLILKKLITKKPFGWKKPFALALHHSLIYISQILFTQRLTYQSYTKGTWQKIFWSYQQAVNLKLLNKSYPNFSSIENKTTIEYEFKKLLLLSLLTKNDLSQNSLLEIQNLMPLWIKHSEILNKAPKEKESCFTFNLLNDTQPYLVGTHPDFDDNSENQYFLSNSKLKILLSNYLDKFNENNSIKIGKSFLSKSTTNSLLSSWTRSHLRAETRKEGTGFVDIVTGITAIHFVLNQQDQPIRDEEEITHDLDINNIDFESTLTIEPLVTQNEHSSLNLNNFVATTELEEDVWGRVFETSINEALPVADWTESGIFKVFKHTKSILLDYSKEGFRLSVNAKKVDSLKHNELVAVRENTLAAWSLAQVKWLHFSNIGDVQFGLRILSHHVLPINIRYPSNNTLSKPLPCLLGLNQKKIVLFVPTLPTNLSEKKLELEHQNKHSKIIVEHKILSTSAFDAYKILEPNNPNFTEKKTPMIINNTENKIWDNF